MGFLARFLGTIPWWTLEPHPELVSEYPAPFCAAVPGRLYVVYLRYGGAFKVDLRPLGKLLADPAVELVIHAADYDVRCLKRDFAFTFTALFDTMLAAKLLGHAELGLAALVKAQFGVSLAKEHQRSDWGRRPLSREQLAYAALDTRYLLPLFDLLAGELSGRGVLDDAWSESARIAAVEPREKVFDPEGWRRLKGARGVDDDELWQHALFFAMSPQQRCRFSLQTARSALSLRRSAKQAETASSSARWPLLSRARH